MKILIPVLGFGNSGGYRVLSKLADELIKLGNDVDFLSPDTSEKPYYPTIASILWADKKGNLVSNNSEMGKKPSAFLSQKQLTSALLKLDSGLYNVVIANHSLTTIPIKIAGFSSKTLYYVQAYEPDYFRLLPGIKNIFLEVLSALSYKLKLFTVVNAEIYLNYKKLKATRFLYPGIDFNYFYPTESKINNRTETIIGTVGRLDKFKGTQYVCNAFKELRKKYSNIKLHIAFGNPDDFLGIEGIICVQPHGDEELGKFYRSLDYYFCAGFSQMGAFHYPVVEAMSCGIPVITTNYYPANSNNSWLVKHQNLRDIICKFEIAYNNEEMRENKIKQALKDIQLFDWEIAGKKMNLFLEELNESNGK